MFKSYLVVLSAALALGLPSGSSCAPSPKAPVLPQTGGGKFHRNTPTTDILLTLFDSYKPPRTSRRLQAPPYRTGFRHSKLLMPQCRRNRRSDWRTRHALRYYRLIPWPEQAIALTKGLGWSSFSRSLDAYCSVELQLLYCWTSRSQIPRRLSNQPIHQGCSPLPLGHERDSLPRPPPLHQRRCAQLHFGRWKD